MRLKNFTIGAFTFAGVLGVVAGLRDVFAPGVFRNGPGPASKTAILLQFLIAGTFLALAVLTHGSQKQLPANRN